MNDELNDDDDWISGKEAAAICRRSQRWLQQQAEAGDVEWRIAGKGRQYRRSSVEALLSDTFTDGTDTTVTQLQNTQRHAQRSIELTMRALTFVVETGEKQQNRADTREQRLLDRIAELERKLDEQREAREEALSLQSERMIAEHAAMQSQERKNLVLKTGLAYLPRVLGQSKVARLIASFDEDQMALARALTNDEQMAFINDIRKENSSGKPEPEPQPEPQPQPDRGGAGDTLRDASEPVGQGGCQGPLDESGGGVAQAGEPGHPVDNSRDGTTRMAERDGDAAVQAGNPVWGPGIEMCVCGHSRKVHNAARDFSECFHDECACEQFKQEKQGKQ